MAFIILTPVGTSVSEESFEDLNLIKSEFAKDFTYATSSLAIMDTSYPIQIIEIEERESRNIREILSRFYESNPDNFDFLTVYGDKGINPTIAGGDHLPIQNKINGIGVRIFDDTSYYGTFIRLKGINFMYDLSRKDYTLENKNTWGNGLLHETGHQWCCFIGDNFVGDGSEDLGIIQQGIHFYRGLESPYETGTPMDSDNWVANGDGTYRRDNMGGVKKYHPFQLYFMGLLPESEYNTKFNIYNAGRVGEDFNPNKAVFYKEVSVNDIIEVEGERNCAS